MTTAADTETQEILDRFERADTIEARMAGAQGASIERSLLTAGLARYTDEGTGDMWLDMLGRPVRVRGAKMTAHHMLVLGTIVSQWQASGTPDGTVALSRLRIAKIMWGDNAGGRETRKVSQIINDLFDAEVQFVGFDAELQDDVMNRRRLLTGTITHPDLASASQQRLLAAESGEDDVIDGSPGASVDSPRSSAVGQSAYGTMKGQATLLVELPTWMRKNAKAGHVAEINQRAAVHLRGRAQALFMTLYALAYTPDPDDATLEGVLLAVTEPVADQLGLPASMSRRREALHRACVSLNKSDNAYVHVELLSVARIEELRAVRDDLEDDPHVWAYVYAQRRRKDRTKPAQEVLVP